MDQFTDQLPFLSCRNPVLQEMKTLNTILGFTMLDNKLLKFAVLAQTKYLQEGTFGIMKKPY